MLKFVWAEGRKSGGERAPAKRLAVGLVLAQLCILSGGAFATAPAAEQPAGAAAEQSPSPSAECAPGGKQTGACASATQAEYKCYLGGFCGSEGWGYGVYAEDTKESTGCGVGEDGVDLWDMGVSHVPPLPDFALSRCTFFYDFRTCSLPTVICLN